MAWLPSRSAVVCDYADPDRVAIGWQDIAGSLAKTCRIAGHCRARARAADTGM